MFEPIKINENQEEPKENVDYSSFIVKPNEINNDLNDYLTGRVPQGFKTGITAIDEHFVCKKNEFYILTGKKGMGKTTVNQALQIMFSVANGLIWVVAFQENSYWSMKLNYMNYLLGEMANDVRKENPVLFQEASDWIDEHFIFINVEDIKTATEVTKSLIESGKDIHALLLDPINSFKNGWQDSGNGYSDGVVAGMNLLNFSKEFCSVHISQHPNMSGQRQEGAVTSYQAEGGWFLNKASFTYVLHREKGSSDNELIVENVRNRHTGGSETNPDNPIVLVWSPTKISISYKNGDDRQDNPIGYLVREHKIFNSQMKEFKHDLPNLDPFDDNPF